MAIVGASSWLWKLRRMFVHSCGGQWVSLTVKHPWCGDFIPSQHLTPRCFMSSPIVCRRKTCLNSEREREIQSRKFPLFRNPGKINYKDNPAIMVFSFCSTTIIISALLWCPLLIMFLLISKVSSPGASCAPAARGPGVGGLAHPATGGDIIDQHWIILGPTRQTWRNMGFMRCWCSSHESSWGSGVSAALLGRYGCSLGIGRSCIVS